MVGDKTGNAGTSRLYDVMVELASIEGTVEEIIFKNEANGYTVCEIRREKTAATIVGYMPFINVGETVKASGRWVKHPDYGDQFKVEYYEKVMPQTAGAIEKYLSSGVIKGVGPVTAAKIVGRFGDSTLEIIGADPLKLSEIKGISVDKAQAIGKAVNEQRGLWNVVVFLQEYGIGPAACCKIYRAYGDDAVRKIKENPYRLCEEIFGISFKTADRIAMRLGVDPGSRHRLESGLKYLLAHASSSGHTYLPENVLVEQAAGLLGASGPDIGDAMMSLAFNNAVEIEKCGDSNHVYLPLFHVAERNVCKRLLSLSRLCFKIDMASLEDRLCKFQSEEGIQLARMQLEAIKEAMANGVLVITGGPGTGKTTIIKCIIRLLAEDGHRIALAAPTGRAAKRMSEATGYEARTIHRLLEISFTENEDEMLFQRNENNPLDADVVIIDEMSMVDILIMNHLLKAISPGSRLILAGDADQLPSVGAGSVLKDIISCNAIKTVRLTEIFRQAAESAIVVNAHRINRGEVPVFNGREGDFFFIPRSGMDSIVHTVVDLCSRRLPETYGFDPMRDIQVISPTRKGPAGVPGLNAELQKALNPPGRKKVDKQSRSFIFREGDRVMQVKNNYSIRWRRPDSLLSDGAGVFNGDMGIIRKIDEDAMVVEVLFDDDRLVEYDFSILDEIEPAFAVTVHKSQGSEFPAVVMPIFPGPPVLMTRNLLYTAVTRAKRMVVMVGDENVLREMVANKREQLRYSGLLDKLKLYARFDDNII